MLQYEPGIAMLGDLDWTPQKVWTAATGAITRPPGTIVASVIVAIIHLSWTVWDGAPLAQFAWPTWLDGERTDHGA